MALPYAEGPWEVKNTLQIVQKGALPGDKAIAYCGDREEIEANAAAIAALPELCGAAQEALWLIKDVLDGHEVLPHEYGAVEGLLIKAIAKAEGR